MADPHIDMLLSSDTRREPQKPDAEGERLAAKGHTARFCVCEMSWTGRCQGLGPEAQRLGGAADGFGVYLHGDKTELWS